MTDTNQQTPLPTLRPGDPHMESLIDAAILGHASTREAMRWLVRQIVPQPAQATQAEVTDDVSLDERFRDWIVTIKEAHDNSLDGEHASSRSMLRGVIYEMEEACAILALRPAAVPMTGWQPIETAPNPGPFLAVLDCGGDQTICTMRHGVIASKNSRPDGDFIRERVTHWMPLPPFPKSTQTGITAQAKKGTP